MTVYIMILLNCLMVIGVVFGKFHLLEREKPTNHAKVARQLVHNAEWASMGTISTIKEYAGFPMVNVIAVADSAKGAKSTGNIYFYLTDLDFTGQDLRNRNNLTALFSADQDLSCSRNGTDPMEPTCARTIVLGSNEELNLGTKEYNFAKNSFISRHPAALHWIETHKFYLCKLKIEQIIVLDWYGGPHYVTPEEYYNIILD